MLLATPHEYSTAYAVAAPQAYQERLSYPFPAAVTVGTELQTGAAVLLVAL